MKTHTADEIEICKQIIRANTERIDAILGIAQRIALNAKNMEPRELEKAFAEVADMRHEVTELKRAIRTAKLAIKEFYAPAIR